MIKRLLEARTIDAEYEAEWKDIPRDIFDKILRLDPKTNIENNKIGEGAKQLLLPAYDNGETDFVDNQDITNCLQTYYDNRGTFDPALRRLSSFETVALFVDFIKNGENSELTKRFQLEKPSEEPKETKLDQLYKEYYSDLPRDLFDKIIALDPETKKDSIGQTAKNLLLPRALKGEDIFALEPEEITKCIDQYNAEKDSYPADKKSVQNFESVKDFIKFIKEGPETDFIKQLKNCTKVDPETGKKVNESINFIGATRRFDIVQPLTWTANRAISSNCDFSSPQDKYFTWCTGWPDGGSQWRNHGSEWICCFIFKDYPAPTNSEKKAKSYQLSITKSSFKVYQFLDGNDKAYGDFNAGTAKSTEFFRDFLAANPDVALILAKTQYFKECPTVKEYVAGLKYMDKPFVYNGPESLQDFVDYNVKTYVKELIVRGVETIPAGAFAECPALETITFEEGLKAIEQEAFMKDISLKTLALPNSLESIKDEAFANCTALKGSIRIPDSLTSIGREAFRETKVTLSINRARTNKIKVDKNDKAWFASHTKPITVQENLQEDIIDENIPRDLAKAYRIANKYNSPEQNYLSNHGELGDLSNRRRVRYDYKNSNYEELTKQEAIQFLGLDGWRIKLDSEGNPELDENGKYKIVGRVTDREAFNNNINKLRFLVTDNSGDQEVVEFEVRAGNRLVPIYTATIASSKFGQYPKFNGNSDASTSNLTRYSDFYTLIQICNKIYKTDEYEHRITDTTELPGRKIKVDVTDPETGEKRSEIRTDTIQNRRNRNTTINRIYRMTPNTDADYHAHELWRNANNTKYTDYVPSEIDTGSHNTTYRFRNTDNYFSAYKTALESKKNAFKKYDYCRRALQKHKAEREYFDEDEYNEILHELEENVNKAKEEYEAVCLKVRKAKNNLVFFTDDIVLAFNKRWKERVRKLEAILNELFDGKTAIGKQALEIAVRDSNAVKTINSKIQNQQQRIENAKRDIQEMEAKRDRLLRELDQIKEMLQNGTTSLESAEKMLNDLLEDLAHINEIAMGEKFRKLDELKAEQKRLQSELDQLAPRSAAERQARAAKNKTKEIDPELTDILDFGEEIPVETTDSEGGDTTTSA